MWLFDAVSAEDNGHVLLEGIFIWEGDAEKRKTFDVFPHPSHEEQQSQNWSGQGESDCLIKTKHCDNLNRYWCNVISAQCSECQSDEIQTSAGKRRE